MKLTVIFFSGKTIANGIPVGYHNQPDTQMTLKTMILQLVFRISERKNSLCTSQHTSDFQAKFEMVWAEKICDRQKKIGLKEQRERPRKKNVANRLTVASFLPVADSIKFSSILGFDIWFQLPIS